MTTGSTDLQVDMRAKFRQATVVLAKGQILGIVKAQGCTVSCKRGQLWVTQDRVFDDLVVSANAYTAIVNSGLAIVSACMDSIIELRDVPCEAHVFAQTEPGRGEQAPKQAPTFELSLKTKKMIREAIRRLRPMQGRFGPRAPAGDTHDRGKGRGSDSGARGSPDAVAAGEFPDDTNQPAPPWAVNFHVTLHAAPVARPAEICLLTVELEGGFLAIVDRQHS